MFANNNFNRLKSGINGLNDANDIDLTLQKKVIIKAGLDLRLVIRFCIWTGAWPSFTKKKIEWILKVTFIGFKKQIFQTAFSPAVKKNSAILFSSQGKYKGIIRLINAYPGPRIFEKH